MDIKALTLGAALALGTPLAVQAQTIVDATDPQVLLDIAKGYGTASLGTDEETGNPMIEVVTTNLTYYVKIRNCNAQNEQCEDLNFYAGFANNKPTLDAINAWNKDWRFGRAYLDADLDAVIEYDVDLEYGVTRENLAAQFALWGGLLEGYTDYIGYR